MSNWKKLKEVSKLIGSGITPSRSDERFWKNGTIPWLKTEQLGEHEIYDTTEKITQIAVDETSIKVFPANTISIAMYGEGRTRGNVSILKKAMTTNQACCNIVVDDKKADFEYVYYFLKTQYQNLRSLSSGIRKNLNANDIKEFEIRLPPEIQTQRKIAAVLSALDAKIELNRRINAELETLAKTLYDYWFVQFDFPDAMGKPYKTSGGKMVWSEALKREVPEGWEVGKIEDLGEIVGGSTPPKENPNYFSESGVAWITPKDLSLNVGNKFISKGETDVSEKGLKVASLKIMPAGTILLSSRAPIGYLAISRNKVTTNQGFKSLIPASRFSPQYVFYVLKNLVPTFEQKAVGSTFKEISAATLKAVEIDLPPEKTIQQFTEIVKPIFEKQDKLETESQHLTALRDWLLPLLMNGQVRVG